MWKIYSIPCDSTLDKFYCIKHDNVQMFYSKSVHFIIPIKSVIPNTLVLKAYLGYSSFL
jgi:hypothetical protein